MPSARELFFKATLETADWKAGIERVIDDMNRVAQMQNKIGDAKGFLQTQAQMQLLGKEADTLVARFQKIAQEYQKLQQFAKTFKPADTTWVWNKERGGNQYKQPFQRFPAGTGMGGKLATAENLEQALLDKTNQRRDVIQQINALRDQGAKLAVAAEEQVAMAAASLPKWEREALGLQNERLFLERQIAQVVSGEWSGGVLQKRLAALDQTATRLNELKTALEQGNIERLPASFEKSIPGDVKAGLSAVKIQERLNDLTEDGKRLNKELGDAFKSGNQELVGRLLLDKKVNEDRRRALESEKKIAERRGVRAESQKGQAAELFGTKESIDRINEGLKEVERNRRKAVSGKEWSTYSAEIERVTGRILRLNAAYQALKAKRDAGEASKTDLRLLEQYGKGLLVYKKQLDDLGDKAAAEGTDVPTVEQVQSRVRATQGLLTKTLTGAFQGFVGRFERTLQYAISGAIIFGAQRLVREFTQAAIEVERAFADIGTALEFDIDAPRGTQAFEQAVDKIRLQVLQIADEFNVLPTEANKAAFVMVSRFGETGNALKAVRAQLLATKVSGIDQTEVLRSLTAVAEGWAAALFDVNDELTVQEKLLKREAISANLYGEALDLAVFIQQKFGIETEDVLEGTARATEVFRQMGFTMEQTAAIVSAVSRQLGQTGVQAAERLVRSIGQLTSEETKNKLLELAAASEAFTLTNVDFAAGGQRVWERIADQFERIEQTEPGVARAILQIVGQRREAEAVAAALGTTELQQAIIDSADQAVGAAEKRYSFLVATVSERIKSIGVAFQELAQNVERLGFLTPLKLFLSALDGTLQLLNKITKAIDAAVNAFNVLRIGDFGLGDALKTALSLALVARGLRGFGGAALKASGFLTTSGQKLQEAGGGGTTAASMIIFGKWLERLTDKTKGSTSSLVVLTEGIGAAGKSLGTFMRQFGQAIADMVQTMWTARLGFLGGASSASLLAGGMSQVAVNFLKFAPWAAALGLATAAVIAMSNAAKEADAALKVLSGIKASGAEAARAAAKAGKTPEEQQQARYEAELRAVNAGIEDGTLKLNIFETAVRGLGQAINESNLPKWLTDVGRMVVDADFRDTSLDKLFFGGDVDLADQADAELTRLLERVEFSPQWAAKQQREILTNYLESTLDVLSQDLGDLGGFDFEGFGDFEALDKFRRLNVKIGGAYQELARAKEAGDPQAIARAEQRVKDLQTEFDDLDAIVAKALQGIEGTLNSVAQEVSRAERGLQLGTVDRGTLRSVREAAVESLRGQLRGLGDDEASREAREAVQAAIDEQLITMNQEDLAAFDRRIARAELIENENERSLTVLNELYGKLRAATSADDIDDIELEIAKLHQERAENALAALDRQLAADQAYVSAATNYQDKLSGLQRVLEDYTRLYNNAEYASQEKSDAYWGMVATENAIADLKLDEASRLLQAQARLSGPIQNKLNAINGQIAAVRNEINTRYLTGADSLELQVKLRELLGQKLEEEARIIAASLLAQAGTSDSIKKLNAQISIAAAELERIAAFFGTNTAEYHNASLALDELQNQLAMQMLELDILNMRLASDSTDDYAQAVITTASILAQLTNPDLGPLERAQLEWALRQQQDAELAAEINGKLFDLKFLYETDQLGKGGYIAALQGLLDSVDTSTQAGREFFLQIQALIDSLSDQASSMAFNIPTAIRLPTLFEVRRALAADQLGVNYQDNRQQDVRVYVSSEVDANHLIDELDELLGTAISRDTRRNAPGGAPLTLGVY